MPFFSSFSSSNSFGRKAVSKLFPTTLMAYDTGSQIDIVNVSNINSISTLATINVSNPSGLRADVSRKLLFFRDNSTGEIVKADYNDIDNITLQRYTVPYTGGGWRTAINTFKPSFIYSHDNTVYWYDYNFNLRNSITNTYPVSVVTLPPKMNVDATFYHEINGREIVETTADGTVVQTKDRFFDFGFGADGGDLEYDDVNNKLVSFDQQGGDDPFAIYNWSPGGTPSAFAETEFDLTNQGRMILMPEVQKIFFAGYLRHSLVDYSSDPLVRQDLIIAPDVTNSATRIGETNIFAVGYQEDPIEFYEVDGTSINLIQTFNTGSQPEYLGEIE